MSELYKNYTIVSGVGKGLTSLSAFDNALLNAGVGDYNLLKVSSILPAKCIQKNNIDIKKGSILHIAYASISTNDSKEICSTVGVAIPYEENFTGVIMEYSQNSNDCECELKKTCESIIINMLNEAYNNRDRKYSDIKLVSSTAKPTDDLYYCTFSGIALW